MKALGIASATVLLAAFIGWIGWASLQLAEIAPLRERVDRIAKALPDVRVKVAYEAVYSPFTTALLVSKPFKDQGYWNTQAHVFDSGTGYVKIWQAKLSGKNDRTKAWLVIGGLKSIDKHALTVDEIEHFSVELKQPAFAPAALDKKVSAISYADAGQISGRLKTMGFFPGASYKTAPVRNWAELVKIMGGEFKIPRR